MCVCVCGGGQSPLKAGTQSHSCAGPEQKKRVESDDNNQVVVVVVAGFEHSKWRPSFFVLFFRFVCATIGTINNENDADTNFRSFRRRRRRRQQQQQPVRSSESALDRLLPLPVWQGQILLALAVVFALLLVCLTGMASQVGSSKERKRIERAEKKMATSNGRQHLSCWLFLLALSRSVQ